MSAFRMPQLQSLQRQATPSAWSQEATVQNAVFHPGGNAAMQEQMNACGTGAAELIDIGGKMSTGVASRGGMGRR